MHVIMNENVVIQEFGDQSIKISHPSHPKRVKESTVIVSIWD